MKVGDLVRMKEEPFPLSRPYGLGLIMWISYDCNGYNCRVFFPDLVHDNFDGCKWCDWKSTLEVVSEAG